MTRFWLLGVLLVGCVVDEDHDGVAQPMADDLPDTQGSVEQLPAPAAGPCATQLVLNGMDATGHPPPVGPLTIDTTGTTICLTLDATDNLWVAHFGASSDRVSSSASPYQITLMDANGHVLRDGWDVTFGSSAPTTFASVEYGVTKGTMLEAKLHVRALSGVQTTSVGLSLFEPYE